MGCVAFCLFFLFFFRFLVFLVFMSKGTKTPKKQTKKHTHGPELADADDGLCFSLFFFLGGGGCFCFICFFWFEQLSPQESEKKLSPHDDPFC